MANAFDSFTKNFYNSMNQRINAENQYINSYLQGINARNSIDSNNRINDQYYGYTQPSNASNLGVQLPQQAVVRAYWENPENVKNLLETGGYQAAYGAGMAKGMYDGLPNDVSTLGNVSKANLVNSQIGLGTAKGNLSNLPSVLTVQKQNAEDLAKTNPILLNTRRIIAKRQYNDLINPPVTQPNQTYPMPAAAAQAGAQNAPQSSDNFIYSAGGAKLRINADGTTTPIEAVKTPLPSASSQAIANTKGSTASLGNEGRGQQMSYLQQKEFLAKSAMANDLGIAQRRLDSALKNNDAAGVALFRSQIENINRSMQNYQPSLVDRVAGYFNQGSPSITPSFDNYGNLYRNTAPAYDYSGIK
jgi:hypothetical protein